MCRSYALGLEVGQTSPVLIVSNPETRATIARVELNSKDDIEHARQLLAIAESWIAFKGGSNGSN